VRRRRCDSLLIAAVTAGTVTASGLLSACAGSTGPAEPTPGPSASDPACLGVLKAAPATVLDQHRIAAGTPAVLGVAQWGSRAIVLRCGVTPTGPTTLDCITVDGVDWVVDDHGDPIRFLTYGRRPAVEVLVPLQYGRENAAGALVDVDPAVAGLPQTRRCVGLGDLSPTTAPTRSASATTP